MAWRGLESQAGQGWAGIGEARPGIAGMARRVAAGRDKARQGNAGMACLVRDRPRRVPQAGSG